MRNSLIVVFSVFAVISFTLPMADAQSSFSWSITCEGSQFQAPGKVGSAHAIWNWTVKGTPENIGSGIARCNEVSNQKNTVSGSGTVPDNANGIIVTLTAQVESGRVCSVSTSQSVSHKGGVSINNLSVTCQGVESGLPTFEKVIFNLQS